MSHSRAADDFTTIRQRMEELRREREAASGHDGDPGKGRGGRDSDAERRRRQRMEGWPPPWVPTIFVKPGRG